MKGSIVCAAAGDTDGYAPVKLDVSLVKGAVVTGRVVDRQTGKGIEAGIRFAPLDCKDEDLQDYRIVSWAIDQLGKKHDKPFFLACGVHKPHMPWNVPRKYYDMYPLDKIQLPPVSL